MDMVIFWFVVLAGGALILVLFAKLGVYVLDIDPLQQIKTELKKIDDGQKHSDL
ncbi:MAG: hypothetical protein OEZ58_11945 [Gammaproteobacteria bacterium]|nr:hypothetical protein [Gammaproteobacteria bacterium]